MGTEAGATDRGAYLPDLPEMLACGDPDQPVGRRDVARDCLACTSSLPVQSARQCQRGRWRAKIPNRALRLGVNPFGDVDPGMRCSWCSQEVGDDVISHTIECSQNSKGDNNRRHQWLQQALAYLFKSIGHGQVLMHPRLLTVFGDGAHEEGYQCAVRARERKVGSLVESATQNQRRQVDIGLIGVLARDEILALDMTVSDGGGSKPQLPYIAGLLCETKAQEKHDIYHGDNGRFAGLSKKQLVVPSYDAMGGCSGETQAFTLHIIKAVAAASPDVHPAATARRVRAVISCALIRSIAVNALDFRNGKILPPSRSVGGLSPSSGSQVSGGSKRRGNGLKAASPSRTPQVFVRRRAQGLLAEAVAGGGEERRGGHSTASQLEPEVTGGAAGAGGEWTADQFGPEGTGRTVLPWLKLSAGGVGMGASASPVLFDASDVDMCGALPSAGDGQY